MTPQEIASNHREARRRRIARIRRGVALAASALTTMFGLLIYGEVPAPHGTAQASTSTAAGTATKNVVTSTPSAQTTTSTQPAAAAEQYAPAPVTTSQS